MVNGRSLLKSALISMILMAVVQPLSAAEKLASCCKTVNKQEITDPILGYLIQRASPPCVQAVIFQTEKGLFCSQLTAPWVRRKIIAFEKAKARATPSPVVPSSTISLLSIITSTASPPSSSTPLSSSSLPTSSPTPFSSSSPSSPPSSSTPLSSSYSLSPSSSSLPPSSSALPSFPFTSEMPAGETFSEKNDE